MHDDEDVDTSWNDDWSLIDWDWTSWEDDWSCDQSWTSPLNEPGQSSSAQPSLQEAQNRTSVTVTELQGSSTSSAGAQVSAVALGQPPGLHRAPSPRATGGKSRSSSMLLAAITLGTFGVGNSALVGPVLTPTCQNPGNEENDFKTLASVGLGHVTLPDFEDSFMNQHLTIASTVETSWILFDSGAAANCCHKNLAPEWPLLPITGTKPPLRSVTGHPLKIHGRKLVGFKAGEVDFYLDFYVTDIDYPLVSVGRLLNQGYQVELGQHEMFMTNPSNDQSDPLHRHGSLLFLQPSIQSFDRWTLNLFVLHS